MPDIRQSVQHEQDAAILHGLEQFATLPGWLASIKDTARTREGLSRILPDFAVGNKILNKVRIGHMLLKENYWQNLCTLKVSLAKEPGEKTIDLNGRLFPPGVISNQQPVVEGLLGEDGWHAILPELNLELRSLEPETVLEAFELLADPEKSRAFLEHHLRTSSPAYRNLSIQSCKPEIVRYKPGNRCTILYHLEYSVDTPAGSDAPAVLVAKTYQKEKGQRAYESMLALWNSSFVSSSTVHIAQPLAYDPEQLVFIQGPVREEQTLSDLIETVLLTGTPQAAAELSESMRKTAIGLAELHKSKVDLGQKVTWDEELADVQAQVKQLSGVFPQLASAAGPFLEKLSQLAEATAPDPLVPSHGTFRPAQVLLYKGEISFIDFDSFCQSEPARDLSLFLSSIMSIGVAPTSLDKGKGIDQLADEANWQARFLLISSICDQFLEVYQQHYPVSRQRVALWEALNLFYNVLSGWMKVKVNETAYLVKLLDSFCRLFFSKR